MPIAILPELAAAFERAGLVLAPWSRLAMLEEQILRRARSAFLVHWFGTSVPTHGLDLHIAIVNIEALKRRYLEVREGVLGAGPELNLLGPLSGIAGLLVGLALSPTGFVLIARYAQQISAFLFDDWKAGVLPWLHWLLGIWLLPVLVPALGIPVFIAGALAAGLGNSREARAVYALLGEAAMLIDAFVRFWDVLSGPRSAIRNPLLRKILDVLDRFAGLFAHVLGLVAVFVTRIARLLPWVMGQFRAFAGLVDAVFAAVVEIFGNLGAALAAPFGARGGLHAIVDRVLDTFAALPEAMLERVTALVERAVTSVTGAFDHISSLINTFLGELRGRVVAAFGQTVVGTFVRRIQGLLAAMPAVRGAFVAAAASRTPTTKDEGDGWLKRAGLYVFTGGLTGSLNDLSESIRNLRPPNLPSATLPDFPATPSLPGLDDVMTRIGRPAGLDTAGLSERLAEEASAALASRPVSPELLRDPASLFARERRELEASAGQPTLLLNDERLRDLIYAAVGRVLPPALRVYAPDVRAFFDMLDERVYDVERPPVERPILDLEDSGRLRPVVHVLTVRSHGGFEPDVRAFRDLVVDELHARTYLAPQPV